MTTPRRQIEHQREQSTRRRANPMFADVDGGGAKGPDGNTHSHRARGSCGVRLTRARHIRVTHHHAAGRGSALSRPDGVARCGLVPRPCPRPLPDACSPDDGHPREPITMIPMRLDGIRRQLPRLRWLASALCLAAASPRIAQAQIVRGTVSSAVGSGRVAGAVILLIDSALTTHARALTTDSGTFVVGAGSPGRFQLKVMRIGFKPTESPAFDLRRDTTIDVVLTDIPVVLPALVARDRNDCRLHPDTTAAGLATFALWDQARTAITAAAITMEQHDYRFTKLLELRIYDNKQHALRDIALREAV